MSKIRRALLSVSNKEGLAARASELAKLGVELISTGGTRNILVEAGIEVLDVSELTGFPEIMDGRVKTLHPAIHGGLLFRRDCPSHIEQAEANKIEPIDLVFIDLYPFEQCVSSGADFATCIENIDIGGPALLRAAAKNAEAVIVCSELDELDEAIAQMRQMEGETTLELRRKLAANAFARVAAYDAAIANWYAAGQNEEFQAKWRVLSGRLVRSLRYGENPHQKGRLYEEQKSGLIAARQVQGKPLSYNNINDLDAALALVSELGSDRHAAVIVKHAGPCGVALADSQEAAYAAARASDPVSAFGGVVALNRPLTDETAQRIAEEFTEAVIALNPTDEQVFSRLSSNTRLLLIDELPDPARSGLDIRSICGGFLAQERDHGQIVAENLKCVTKLKPDEQQIRDLLFGWKIAKHARSNAVIYARDEIMCGIGAGQTSRVEAARLGGQKARGRAKKVKVTYKCSELGYGMSVSGHQLGTAIKKSKNRFVFTPLDEYKGDFPSFTRKTMQAIKIRLCPCIAASDAFFPFPDGLEQVAEAGARAVIQPGGSIRDKDVIEAADRLGLAMVFTGMRHFRH